jgi:hypothetical protein
MMFVKHLSGIYRILLEDDTYVEINNDTHFRKCSNIPSV